MVKDGSMTYPIKSCESNCLFAVSSIIRKIRKITLATTCGSPRRGGLRFENLVLRVAEGESPYRVRAFPDSLYADRIGHGRSIEFAPVNRQLTSLLHTRSHFRISNPAAVHFRSIRSGNENTYGDAEVPCQNTRCARDSLASGRERTHVARLICRCHASGIHGSAS